MIRTFACSSMLVVAITCHSQPVTVQPSSIPGIDIAGRHTPEFAVAVAEVVGWRTRVPYKPQPVALQVHVTGQFAAAQIEYLAAENGTTGGFSCKLRHFSECELFGDGPRTFPKRQCRCKLKDSLHDRYEQAAPWYDDWTKESLAGIGNANASMRLANIRRRFLAALACLPA